MHLYYWFTRIRESIPLCAYRTCLALVIVPFPGYMYFCMILHNFSTPINQL